MQGRIGRPIGGGLGPPTPHNRPPLLILAVLGPEGPSDRPSGGGVHVDWHEKNWGYAANYQAIEHINLEKRKPANNCSAGILKKAKIPLTKRPSKKFSWAGPVI